MLASTRSVEIQARQPCSRNVPRYFVIGIIGRVRQQKSARDLSPAAASARVRDPQRAARAQRGRAPVGLPVPMPRRMVNRRRSLLPRAVDKRLTYRDRKRDHYGNDDQRGDD